jgi:hypothetical protein
MVGLLRLGYQSPNEMTNVLIALSRVGEIPRVHVTALVHVTSLA